MPCCRTRAPAAAQAASIEAAAVDKPPGTSLHKYHPQQTHPHKQGELGAWQQICVNSPYCVMVQPYEGEEGPLHLGRIQLTDRSRVTATGLDPAPLPHRYCYHVDTTI
jgi:hypothetical protein